jgi:hypothetical protein
MIADYLTLVFCFIFRVAPTVLDNEVHSLTITQKLPLFMGVLNAFCIPYLVIHDEDPIDPELKPGGSKHDPDKLREDNRAFEENRRIKEACD